MKKCNNPNCNCVDCPNGAHPWSEWPNYRSIPDVITKQPCQACAVLLMVIPPEGWTCPSCGTHYMGSTITC